MTKALGGPYFLSPNNGLFSSITGYTLASLAAWTWNWLGGTGSTNPLSQAAPATNSATTTATNALVQSYALQWAWDRLPLKGKIVLALGGSLALWRIWKSTGGANNTHVVVHTHVHLPQEDRLQSPKGSEENRELRGLVSTYHLPSGFGNISTAYLPTITYGTTG